MIQQMSYIALLLALCALPTSAQMSSENYVQSTNRLSDTQTLSTTQYYDGLGRPTAKVVQGVTPAKENLVMLQQYDGLGRESKQWLPVKSASAYQTASDVASLSKNQYGDSYAYKSSVYDGSPLNRVTRLEGEGEAWSGHPVKQEYLINSSSFPLNCKYYRVSMQGVLQDKGYYPENRLYVMKTTDEDGHEQYEFKNIAGNVVLHRTMTGSKESADTYYIYDYRGNLSFVLPPNYQDEPSLSLYAYQYQYDGRNNCIYKKLPGCEPVYMRYNRANRLSFMQDGNLRKQGLWEFYVYDKLVRLVVTATTASVTDVSESYTYAQYTGSGSLDGYALYGASVTPKSLLLVNYYDDYAFLNKCDAASKQSLGLNVSQALESAFPSNAAPNAKGYQTGRKVYLTDGSNRYVLSSVYYGLKGRVVQSHSTNLLGGFEHTYTRYTYAGSPLQSKHIHTASGKRNLQEDYAYEYDHTGRHTKTSYSVNGSTKRVLSSVVYDDYGRIKSQTLLGKETVSHEYNLRSWPLSISSSHYNQKMAYNTSANGLTPQKAMYGGNISAMSWQSANKAVQGYQLEYNSQSMLTDANYGEGQSLGSNKERYDEHLSYDKMGNIQMLLRYGLRDDNKYGLIDNLDYTYNGNQLTKVDDAVKGPYYTGAFHFVDGARASVEYTYDANGNMVKDLNKGISSIQYDINNLPRTISYSDGRKASYVYGADGKKLSVSYNLTAMTSSQPQLAVMQSPNAVSANATNGQKTIHYCGNIIYDGDETMILNDVGYALYDKNGNLSFHYYLKDHLGDNRVVMSESGTVEQVNDYYPTGALMGSSTGSDKQRYKYNGKELDRLNGLDWYDYGARFYDAEIVRWWVGDEKSNEYCSISPYVYCSNNPICIIDPDGKRLVLVGSYAQRMSFLQVLQKLTNDNLLMNRKTGVVYLSGKPRWSNRNKKLSVGTSLVRDIIVNNHTLKIQMSGGKNQEDATNKTNGRTRGKGSDATVYFNEDRGTSIGVADKKGNASPGNNVAFSALGHELIHGLRDMEGVASKGGEVIYTFKNWQGRFVERKDYPEELITTGLPYKESYKYTENKIRKEHGLPVRVYH